MILTGLIVSLINLLVSIGFVVGAQYQWRRLARNPLYREGSVRDTMRRIQFSGVLVVIVMIAVASVLVALILLLRDPAA